MTMIIPGTPQFDRFQAVLIRGHCKMMAAGMTHSKISKTRVLELAGKITGKKYKRGQHDLAAQDIKDMLDAEDKVKVEDRESV